MKLGITVSHLKDGSGYISQVDWSKGDAGQVGTPGAVKYSHCPMLAEDLLEDLLKSKGHEIIYRST